MVSDPQLTLDHLLHHKVSNRFRRVSADFCLTPERLATLLCENFAENPPRRLVIVTRAVNAAALHGQFPGE